MVSIEEQQNQWGHNCDVEMWECLWLSHQKQEWQRQLCAAHWRARNSNSRS